MKHFDYIIVGQGLAGSVLAFNLRLISKTVFVIDRDRENTSSKIALGVYNPMVLKRFTPSWKVEEQLDPLYDFIKNFQQYVKLIVGDNDIKFEEPNERWEYAFSLAPEGEFYQV